MIEENEISEDSLTTEDDGSEAEESIARIKKYDISSYPADYTITTILSKYNTVITVPEFQRRYVWSNDVVRQSKLIESLLLGLPVPQIFLFQRKDDKNLLIIDGFQRLHTLHRFCNNEFALEGVEKEWNGKKYSGLSGLSTEDKEQFDNTTIRAIIVRQLSPDDKYSSMYHIFERLNTGGMVLSPMEIRKAISYGPFYKTLEKLNIYNGWQSVINRTTTEYRLRDIEWILRIFAFYVEGVEKYEEPLKDFLTDFLHKNKDNSFDEIAEKFRNTCDDVISEIGKKPFHFPKGRLNLAVLDSVFVTLLKKGRISELNTKYSKLLDDKEFNDVIQSRNATKKAIAKLRLEIVERYLV